MEIKMERPFLVWREDWQLKHDCLDEQHEEFVGNLNQLHHFVFCGDNQRENRREEISQYLDKLIEIARRHFKTEEALMRMHEYPGLTEHHCEHVFLLAELKEWAREIKTGEKAFTVNTLKALKHWQIDHVIYSDKHFGDYLNNRLLSMNDETINEVENIKKRSARGKI
jgi:hemerythrin-like metal-binding protein